VTPAEHYQNFFDGFHSPTQVLIIGPQEVSTFLIERDPKIPTVYVDGGARWRENSALESGSIVVGDGDSFDGAVDVHLPKEKDFSDFAFALKNLPPEINEIETHGFLGGDTAHEFLNFGEAHHLLKKREGTTITFNGAIWGFSPGEWSFYINGRFSLINFEKCEMSLNGLCDFQIKSKKYIEPVTSLGLGNTAHGKVNVDSSGAFFIFAEKPLTIA
jgi:thiamine pyrophosphokinase